MLPVCKATSSANWDPQALWKSIGGRNGCVLETKTSYPMSSAGVIPGLTNLKEKQEDLGAHE